MKTVFVCGLVLVAALAAVVAEPPQPPPHKCEDRPDQKKDLFLPVPGHCDQYLWCYLDGNGAQRQVVMTCANGGPSVGNLYFDYLQQLCNWPDQVKCSN